MRGKDLLSVLWNASFFLPVFTGKWRGGTRTARTIKSYDHVFANVPAVRRMAAVFRSAVLSRFFVWLLGFLAYHLLPTHEADAEHSVEWQVSGLDPLVHHTTAMFAHWDGVYFHRIAVDGYRHEKDFAFFPLFPLAVRGVSCSLLALPISLGWLSRESAMLLGTCLALQYVVCGNS